MLLHSAVRQCTYCSGTGVLPADNIDFQDINSFLRSLVPPVDTVDRDELKRFFASAHEYITSVEAILSTLENTARDLRQSKNQMTKILYRYDNILSPIENIPTELLQNIFYLAIPPGEIPYPQTLSNVSPWTCSWVSSKWRQAALAHPLLWGMMQRGQKRDRYYLTYVTQPAASVDLQISRAGNAPVTGVDLTVAHPATDILLSSSCRWTSLRVSATHLQKPEMRPVIQNLPMLHSLVLEETGTVPIMLNNAPRLAAVTLSGFYFDSNIPWGQLTTLSWGSVNRRVPSDDILILLGQCTNLQVLTISVPMKDSGRGKRPIILPVLEKLTLDGRSSEIAPLLVLPNIQHIYCKPDDDYQFNSNVYQIESLLRRSDSGPSLRSLSTLHHIDPDNFGNLMCIVPGVTNLGVKVGYSQRQDPYKTLRLLDLTETGYLPLLRSLKIEFVVESVQAYYKAESILHDIVVSRVLEDSPLLSLAVDLVIELDKLGHVKVEDWRQKQFVDSLKEYTEDGLQVTLNVEFTCRE